QRAVDQHNRRIAAEQLRIRVGLHVGEPIRREDDYFGTAVVVAKRLCDSARGGQILVSELTRELVGARGEVVFSPVGELALKGLSHPVAACELVWRSIGGRRVPLQDELVQDQGMLVERDHALETLARTWRQVQSEGARIAVVVGEPGIGKTRL